MKPLLKLTAIAAIALTACQKAETTISVNLTDLPEGAVVEIYKFEGRVGDRVFSDTVHNGVFCKTYVCDSFNTNTYYDVEIVMGNYYSHRYVYISPNTNSKVSGSDIYSAKWTVTSKNPHQRFENDMNDATGEINDEMRKLESQLQNPEVTPEERQPLINKLNSLGAERTDLTLSAMEKLPVDEYWMGYLENYSRMVSRAGSAHPRYAQIVELYNRMSEADKATPSGKIITQNIFGKTPAVGEKYIDLDFYDAEGNSHHLAEYQGKWMLLEFSSYGCEPCRTLTPAFNYLYGRGIGKTLEIIALTEDEKSVFEDMAATDKPVYPLWNNRERILFPTYQIYYMPTFYLVSPEGTIAETWHGAGSSWPRIVDAILKADAFPKPEFKNENNVTVITFPKFASNNSVMFVDKVELYADSTVINCSYPSFILCTIRPETYLMANSKKIKILKTVTRQNKVIPSSLGISSNYRVTFEPLPQGTTEFDFIEGDCDGCFRVTGIKVRE